MKPSDFFSFLFHDPFHALVLFHVPDLDLDPGPDPDPFLFLFPDLLLDPLLDLLSPDLSHVPPYLCDLYLDSLCFDFCSFFSAQNCDFCCDGCGDQSAVEVMAAVAVDHDSGACQLMMMI